MTIGLNIAASIRCCMAVKVKVGITVASRKPLLFVALRLAWSYAGI
jgi:hypothetical protein